MVASNIGFTWPNGFDHSRKGAPCHIEILKAYPNGLQLSNSDAFVIVDVIPNRLSLTKSPS